ncbi:9261_t:CDS:2 [Diversispora eburnea]|uniref:Cytochrome c oxidase subunit 9, mitochondrial n=1 Tax=Diversispora eburnea TaxID=1213867 RepID=A0A9N8VB37_9GLOM|nr:9261_t:CDS:2 [Diversispora eburnea]
MAISPITGMVRKSAFIDITASLVLGTFSGYAYWYGYHVPIVRKREAYYSKLRENQTLKK